MIACVVDDAAIPATSIARNVASAERASPTRACAEQTVLYATASGAIPAATIRSSHCCAAAGAPALACEETTDE